MIIIPQVFIILFSLFLINILYKIFYLVFFNISHGPKAKKRLFSEEPESFLGLGGEVTDYYYEKYMKTASTNKNLHISIIIGRNIWLTPQNIEKYFEANGELKSGASYWDVHSLFRRKRDFPKKTKIYVKKKHNPIQNEMHFGIGVKSKLVFCEKSHTGELSKGGYIFETNDEIYKLKLQEFYDFIADENFCEELTNENADRLFPTMTFKTPPSMNN